MPTTDPTSRPRQTSLLVFIPAEPGSVIDRVRSHATNLHVHGDPCPERHVYVDSATNVNLTSSCDNAVCVTAIPPSEQTLITGVGGGVAPTHYVDRLVPCHIRRPGFTSTYRSLWSPAICHNIISTTTLGQLGFDVYISALEGGQMYLSPAGTDPRSDTVRLRCVRAGGLHLLPADSDPQLKSFQAQSTAPLSATPIDSQTTLSCSGVMPVQTNASPGNECHISESENVQAQSDVLSVQTHDSSLSNLGSTSVIDDGPHDRCVSNVDSDVTTSAEASINVAVPLPLDGSKRVPRRQRRPVPYDVFRRRLGNPSHADTTLAAKRMGVRLIGADSHRTSLDRERATANQTANPARVVNDPGIFPRARISVLTDTVGPLPISALHNRYFQSWFIKGQPEFLVVTCSSDKSAASSWTGFEEFARVRGVALIRDAIHQSLEIVHDAGTEYLGDFLKQCQRAGFVQRASTPYKEKKFGAHPSEGANRRLQSQMRSNLVGARANFAAWEIDARLYWDRAVTYGARQITVRAHCRNHHVSYDQVTRELLAPGFGALGSVKLQSHDTSHRETGEKQLADRSVPGLFLGITPNHKCVMLLQDSSVMVTSDVQFHTEHSGIPAPLPNDKGDADWLAPFIEHPQEDNSVTTSAATTHEPEPGLPVVTPTVSTDVMSTDYDGPSGTADILSSPPASAPSFFDSDNHPVCVGDSLTVTQEGIPHTGIVTDIDLSNDQTLGGAIRVDFGIEANEHRWFPLQPHRRSPMHRHSDPATTTTLMGTQNRQLVAQPTALRTSRRPTSTSPHPSVQPHLDGHGNILAKYLDGSDTLPPQPPMPTYADAIVIPTDTVHALSLPEAIFWLHSHIRELRGHLAPTHRPPTFHYTLTKPEGRRLYIKFVYTIKYHADGTIAKFKARAVIAGWWLQRGVHYSESYTGQSPWSDVRDLEALGVMLALTVYEADLVQAFPSASLPPAPNGQPVIAQFPSSSRLYDASGAELFANVDQAWYGHPAAGFALASKLCRCFTGQHIHSDEEQCTVPLQQHPAQPVVFKAIYPTHHKWHREIFWLHVSTDNLRSYTSCPAIQAEFMAWLTRNFQTTGGRVALQDQEPQTFNGVRFSYVQGSVQLDMPLFVTKLIAEAGLTNSVPVHTPLVKGTVLRLADSPITAIAKLSVVKAVNTLFPVTFTAYSELITYYGHMVSSIGWIAGKVAPILLLTHSLLCRMLSAPTVDAFHALKRVLRYLSGWPTIHVTYKPLRTYNWRAGDWPDSYIMQSDASYADDPNDRRSQGGYTGGFHGMAITTAESRKGHRVATSTDQAEAQHAAAACKQAEYKRNFFKFLGMPLTDPTPLYLDNYATYLRTNVFIRKWSPASKQHDVLERYLGECAMQQIIVPKHRPGSLPANPQPGDGFPADALTKIHDRSAVQFYTRVLHGPDLLEGRNVN